MKTKTAPLRSVSRRHDWVDERSRALHAAIAGKIRRDPKLLGLARQTLSRWMKNAGSAVQPGLQTWQIMIDTLPLEELLSFLVEDSQRANELRQSSPFTGILTGQERNEIFARYESL